MKIRDIMFVVRLIIIVISLIGCGMTRSVADAKPSEFDLKSDLELEIEGKRAPKSQPETQATPKPTPKPKRTGKEYKFKSTPVPVSTPPEPVVISMPTPQPMPPATPTPTPMPTPTPTPLPPQPVSSLPPQIIEPVRSEQALSKVVPRSIEGRLELAQKFYDQKEFDKVIDLLRPVNDVLPRSGLLLLAKAYAAKKDTLNELRTLELCIAKNPKDYVVHTMYGHALVRAKRVEDGILAFQESRTLNPRYRPAYEALLAELEGKGERYESRNVVNDMIKVFGPEPEFYTALCRLYSADSYHEKVVELCEQAIDKDPRVPENHVYLGLSLKDREETERAHRILTNAAKRFPAAESVQSAMGELYIAKKDFVSAYNYFKRASGANSKSPRAWIGYGVSAFELQKNEEALTAFTTACALNKTMTKEFRSAIGKLRVRKDVLWRSKYEMGISGCQ